MKIIEIPSCRECPYLRYPWSSALCTVYACGNSFEGTERPKGGEHWLGGDALPGDKLMYDIDTIQVWCKLNNKG
jgi:hypothetical protein